MMYLIHVVVYNCIPVVVYNDCIPNENSSVVLIMPAYRSEKSRIVSVHQNTHTHTTFVSINTTGVDAGQTDA